MSETQFRPQPQTIPSSIFEHFHRTGMCSEIRLSILLAYSMPGIKDTMQLGNNGQ